MLFRSLTNSATATNYGLRITSLTNSFAWDREASDLIDVRVYGVKGDGSDQLTRLTNLFATVPRGATVMFPKTASLFRVSIPNAMNTGINLTNELTIIGEPGSALRMEIVSPSFATALFNVNTSNLNVRGLNLLGPTTLSNQEYRCFEINPTNAQTCKVVIEDVMSSGFDTFIKTEPVAVMGAIETVMNRCVITCGTANPNIYTGRGNPMVYIQGSNTFRADRKSVV